MSTGEVRSTTAKTKRRWLQFSLTGLFVGVTLIAGLFLLLENYVRPYRAQQRATEEIIKFGGRVWWEPAAPQWLPAILGDELLQNVWMAEFHGRKVTDEVTQHLKAFTKLRRLTLRNTRITDDGLADLSSLTDLETLNVGSPNVTDDGLRHLVRLPNLTHLSLTDMDLSDEAVKHLTNLRKLDWLAVGPSKISNDGLRQLFALPELHGMYISSSAITDAGLIHVQNATKLRHLQLNCRNLTDEGLATLRLTLPSVKIMPSPLSRQRQFENAASSATPSARRSP